MQTSSPTLPKPPQPKQILFIGPPGCGKTGLGMQFPNPYFIDADLNLDGAERRLRLKYPNLEYRYDTVSIDENGKLVDEADRFDRAMRCLDQAEKDPWVKTVILDSLTNLTQFLIWQIQAKQKVDQMRIPDWGTHRQKVLGLLIKRRACGKTFILTCHQYEKTKKNEKNLEEILIGYIPAINPGLQEDLAGMFTDVWNIKLVPKAGNEYENRMQTMPTGLMPFLKNSLGLPSDCLASWDEIKKYWPKDQDKNLVNGSPVTETKKTT